MSTIKIKPHTLHQENRKDAGDYPRNHWDPMLHKLQSVQVKDFPLKSEPQGTLLEKNSLGNSPWFPRIQFTVLSHPGAWRPLQPWSKGAQLPLALVVYWCVASFSGMRNARIVGAGRFPLRFQRRPWRPGSVPVRGQYMKMLEWTQKCSRNPRKLKKPGIWNF